MLRPVTTKKLPEKASPGRKGVVIVVPAEVTRRRRKWRSLNWTRLRTKWWFIGPVKAVKSSWPWLPPFYLHREWKNEGKEGGGWVGGLCKLVFCRHCPCGLAKELYLMVGELSFFFVQENSFEDLRVLRLRQFFSREAKQSPSMSPTCAGPIHARRMGSPSRSF